jgi:hypothetical protein
MLFVSCLSYLLLPLSNYKTTLMERGLGVSMFILRLEEFSSVGMLSSGDFSMLQIILPCTAEGSNCVNQ